MEAWQLPKRDFQRGKPDRFQSASCQPSKIFSRSW